MVGQDSGYRCGVCHKLLAYSTGQSVERAHRRNYEPHRCLVAREQSQADITHRIARSYGIVAWLYPFVILIVSHQRGKCHHATYPLCRCHFVCHCAGVVFGINLYIAGLCTAHLWTQYLVGMVNFDHLLYLCHEKCNLHLNH